MQYKKNKLSNSNISGIGRLNSTHTTGPNFASLGASRSPTC